MVVGYGVRGSIALSKTTNRKASAAEWNKQGTNNKGQKLDKYMDGNKSGLCEQILEVRVRTVRKKRV